MAFFCKKKLANQNENPLVVKGVNTTKRYIGTDIISGDVLAKAEI